MFCLSKHEKWTIYSWSASSGFVWCSMEETTCWFRRPFQGTTCTCGCIIKGIGSCTNGLNNHREDFGGIESAFAYYRLPCKVVSENSPPLQSLRFSLREMEWNTSVWPPYYPATNGEPEGLVHTFKRQSNNNINTLNEKPFWNTPSRITGITWAGLIIKLAPEDRLAKEPGGRSKVVTWNYHWNNYTIVIWVLVTDQIWRHHKDKLLSSMPTDNPVGKSKTIIDVQERSATDLPVAYHEVIPVHVLGAKT